MTATALTAVDMQRALWRHFIPRYAVLFEISTDLRDETITVNGHDHPWKRRRRIDVLLAQPARKQGIGPVDLLAIEIKVSRADFLADVRQPEKQASWREIAHRHAYAVPSGLVQPSEVPSGSGLLTVRGERGGQRHVQWARRAPYSHSPPIPAWLTMTLAWRLSAAEAKTRGLSRSDGEMSAEDLRGALAEARQRADRLQGQLDRAKTAAREWRAAFAAAGHLPCGHCHQLVRPRVGHDGYLGNWRHVSPSHDAACAVIRAGVSRWARVTPAEDPLDAEDGAA